MVASALDGLPQELGRLMSNVAVTVEQGAGPPGLLGLAQGLRQADVRMVHDEFGISHTWGWGRRTVRPGPAG
jgi:hypothetical protein